jgi:hypothetical protein
MGQPHEERQGLTFRSYKPGSRAVTFPDDVRTKLLVQQVMRERRELPSPRPAMACTSRSWRPSARPPRHGPSGDHPSREAPSASPTFSVSASTQDRRHSIRGRACPRIERDRRRATVKTRPHLLRGPAWTGARAEDAVHAIRSLVRADLSRRQGARLAREKRTRHGRLRPAELHARGLDVRRDDQVRLHAP